MITGGGTDQGKHKAYITPIEAFRRVRDDCEVAGVPLFHKQNGEWLEDSQINVGTPWIPDSFTTIPGSRGRYNRVGKKAAGRMLDGRTHDARPTVRHLEAA